MKACEPLTISSESGYNLQTDESVPIAHAWNMIARDHKQVFGREPLQTEVEPSIIIRYAQEGDSCPHWPEGYCLRFVAGSKGTVLHIIGRDELGIIYGLLHYSRFALGVEPFWFWAELLPLRR
ncbi:hypothetical protein GRP75_28300, partial [Paenibacillus sp. OT2-17]|nr:hypothetical protein [Paenibacillus sp. OT2-17]